MIDVYLRVDIGGQNGWVCGLERSRMCCLLCFSKRRRLFRLHIGAPHHILHVSHSK